MRSHSLPRIPSVGQRERLPRLVYTVLECQSCHAKVKRAFVDGDFVTKEEGKCAACGGPMRISTIYSEEAPRQK